MVLRKKHYFLICFTALLLSIFALILNIKTVPLIKKQHLNTKKIRLLKEENQHLNYYIQKETTLEKIEEKAKKLNMIYLPTKKINHLFINPTQ